MMDSQITFIYGAQGRDRVKVRSHIDDIVEKNFFLGSFIFQTISWASLKKVATKDSVILGDISSLIRGF